jgi:hypothetical protein
MRLRDRMNNDLDGVEYNSDEEDEEEEEEEWTASIYFLCTLDEYRTRGLQLII